MSKKRKWFEVMNDLEGNLPDYDCKDCKNKGVIYYENNGYEYYKPCSCMNIRSSIKRIKASGMSEMLCKYTLSRFETNTKWQESIKKAAMSFINECSLSDHLNTCFFAGGAIGRGKTHICTAIVNELLKSGKPVRYMQWRDDVVKIKANANSDEYSKLIEPFKNIEVLYIDDMFKTKKGELPTAADVNVAFEIINHRYLSKKYITIISTEKTGMEFNSIDEATGSRVAEMAGRYFINISANGTENYRLKGM